MKFFYDLKNKILENLFLIILFLILIILNDAFLLNYDSLKNKSISQVIQKKEELFNDSKEETKTNTIKVDIKGYVKKPNVYEISEESNVLDLINMAGGLKKGATTENINLSKKLKDEMVVIVSKKSDIKKKNITSDNPQTVIIPIESEDVKIENSSIEGLITDEVQNIDVSQNIDKKTNLNNATLEELLMLPGIGEAKANSIIEYRSKTKFNTIEDVKNISGIGDSLFDKIKDKITV